MKPKKSNLPPIEFRPLGSQGYRAAIGPREIYQQHLKEKDHRAKLWKLDLKRKRLRLLEIEI